jgi:energy-coupling factor transporter ATP-binding protein EcfA2
VTGTPGSGKTTLLRLLHHVIHEDRPNARVFVVNGWPKMALESFNPWDRWPEMVQNWDGYKKDDFYLIDEGHTSYWDLWKDFKDKFQSTSIIDAPYAVLFCSYSDNLRETHNFTPPGLKAAKLTLARITTPPDGAKDMTPVGLLLDWGEYLGVLHRFTDEKLLLDDELKRFIFEFTAGHVGAVKAMFEYMIKTVRCLIPYHTLLLIFFQGGTRHFRRISEKGPYISKLNSAPNRASHCVPFAYRQVRLRWYNEATSPRGPNKLSRQRQGLICESLLKRVDRSYGQLVL